MALTAGQINKLKQRGISFPVGDADSSSGNQGGFLESNGKIINTQVAGWREAHFLNLVGAAT